MIKIAFIHKAGHPHLSSEYFSPQIYRFFIRGLMKNPRVSVYPITTVEQFRKYGADNFDIILFVGLKLKRDIDKSFISVMGAIKKPKIACSFDCHKFPIEVDPIAKQMGVTNFFYHHNKSWFYRFAAKDYNYRQIFMCLDESLVKNVLDWKYRQKDKILVTGAVNHDEYYALRVKCATLPYVWYVDRREQFIASRFQFLLQSFRATVAACDVYTVNKYIEAMSCACITFAQANNINHWENLGLVDGGNCIFINKTNYEEKMMEYINDKDNPKWEEIAYRGREHILRNFNLTLQVNKFVDYVEELI